MPMTPRERWLALLNGEKPDRIPTDYSGTPEVTRRLQKELGCADQEELYRKLHADRLDCPDAAPIVPHHPNDPESDIWGIRRKQVNYGSGVYWEAVTHPLAAVTTVEEVHAFHWPDPSFGRKN